jgi:hypothetical protein
MSILRDWEMAMVDTARRRAFAHHTHRPLRNLSGCVLYVETPQFAADRINAALGATAGILPDQQTLLQLPIRMARHP